MTPRHPKLELTWIGKENRPRLEPRILPKDPARLYFAAHRVSEHDLFDNRLILGDNLLALKALEQEFADSRRVARARERSRRCRAAGPALRPGAPGGPGKPMSDCRLWGIGRDPAGSHELTQTA